MNSPNTLLKRWKSLLRYRVAGQLNVRRAILGLSLILALALFVPIAGAQAPSPISVAMLPGAYQNNPVGNDWHIGSIVPDGTGLRWTNKAGVSWRLTPDLANQRLLTGPDNPYFAQGQRESNQGLLEFKLIISNGQFTGFTFAGGTYTRNIPVAIAAPGQPAASTATLGAPSPISVAMLPGAYQNNPVGNDWHIGSIVPDGTGLRWTNKAGVSWRLTPDLANQRLLTGPDNPYFAQGQRESNQGLLEFKLIISNGQFTGFTFAGGTYTRNIPVAIAAPGQPAASTATLEAPAPMTVAEALKVVSTYTIQQKGNGRFLDAHETGYDFSAVTRPAQNDNSQRWVLTPGGPNTYTIQQKGNGRYLDAHEQSGNDWSAVTRPAQNDNSQRWVLTPGGPNTYTIQQKSNGRYLDAHEQSGNDWSAVTRPAQNDDSQKWILTLVSVSGCSGCTTVTHFDIGSGGTRLGQYRQTAPGRWIKINAEGWETAKLIEKSRNARSVVLSNVQNSWRWEFDLPTKKLKEAPLVPIFPTKVFDILNTTTYPVPVPVVPTLPPVGKSPGFYIVNQTDWPLQISLDQVGCLYHGSIQPGEAFVRDTGAVWFTIKATVNPSGQDQLSTWDCAKPIAIITAAALATAASGGWAAYGGIAAASGGGLAAFAGSAGFAMTSTTTIVVGATIGGGISGAAIGLGLKEVAIDEIIPTLEANGHASNAGEYAGPPYPFRDAQMPRYIITGGPTFKFNYNLGTPVFDKGTPLQITKQ